MDTIRIVVIFISLFSSLSAHPSVPSIIVQEGQSAEISCLAKGSHDAYFWWKGEYLHNSTEIASFVGGIPSSPTGSYKATENGTLIIKKVSLNDEGKYICRVSSTLSDCNGVLMVYVQASIPGFALGIDLCDGDASCVIQIAPSKSTKLTCQATDASPSMELKWFNGSTEITEGIEFEDPVITGTSRAISATINLAPECAGSLICQAVDPKTKDDGGRFAHVQLELPGSAITEASTGWMVTAIIFLVTCIILIAAFAFIIVKSRKTEGAENNKQEEGEQLMEANKDRELKAKQEEVEALTSKVIEKDSEIKGKAENIMELTSKVREKDSEIKRMAENIMELTKKVYDATSDIKVKDVSAKAETHIKDNELQVKVRELTKLQEEVDKKDIKMKSYFEENSRLKEVIQSRDRLMKSKDSELSRLTEVIQSRDRLMESKDNELFRLTEVIQSRDRLMESKDNELSRLNTAVQSKERLIKSQHDELSRLNALELKSNDISSKHKAAVKHETELQTKLKEIKLEEEKIKINFRNLENSERSFRAKKMDDLGKNYVAVVPKEKSLVSIKRDDSGLTMKHSSGSYKLDHSFSIGATAREIYEKVNCYIENAIDGGDSLVVAFGTSRNNPQLCTMYGDTEWKSAILPLTYKKIFERANQLKTGKYAVKIRSRFVHVLEDENYKETFILPKSTLVDTCKDPKAIPSIESKDENSIERLFLEHRESIMKGSSKQNCFVQFVINTEDENNTITTGTITLATLHAATVAKATLEKEAFKPPLEQYLFDIVHNANSRCLLLAHLNEDKEDIKEVLKVVKTITERKKK